MSCTLSAVQRRGSRDFAAGTSGEVALVSRRIGMVSQTKCRQRWGEREWEGGWVWEVRQRREKAGPSST